MIRKMTTLLFCLALMAGLFGMLPVTAAFDASPAASTTIVISEFRTRGPLGGNDEFVEIFNLSSGSVDIGGWKISGSGSTGSTNTRVTISPGVSLGAGCRYLITNSSATGGYSGLTPGDQTYGTGIADNGGIALLDAGDVVIDQVGMSTGSAYKEGSTLAPTTASIDQSYERKPAGDNTTDTDDNASDFLYNDGSSNPQNSSSSCTPLAVTLASFTAEPQADHIVVAWETVSEFDTAGFNLYRSEDAAGPLTLLAHLPSHAPGSTLGAAYSYEDPDVQPGQTYWYWLEDISLGGATTLHGPVSATVSAPTAVTLASLQATPAAPAIPAAGAVLASLAGLMAATGVAVSWRRAR